MKEITAEGFYLVDKPVGISSFQALYPLKKKFRGFKIGHAGTLDPAASGLLLVGVGNATRLLEYLEGMIKTYSFELCLGITTDSYDLEGEVLTRSPIPSLTRAQLEAELIPFRGKISQMPPVYSALKIGGKRACDLARAGETVVLAARDVEIFSLEIVHFSELNSNVTVTLEMVCSKGTYVRSLAHDLGQVLGCGAVADKIRRLAIGAFRVENALPPTTDWEASHGHPLEQAIQHLPGLKLLPEAVPALAQGQRITAKYYTVLETAKLPLENAEWRVLSSDDMLLAIALIDAVGVLHPRKVFIS